MALNYSKIILYSGIAIVCLLFIVGIIIVAVSADKGYIWRQNSYLDDHPLVDGHNDISWLIRKEYNGNLIEYNFKNCINCSTSIEKLHKGGISTQFMSTRAECKAQHKDAISITLEEIDIIKRLIQEYPSQLELVTNATGLKESYNRKKIGIVISVEGGHSIGLKMSNIRMFYDLGVRRMTFVQNCSTPWAIPNTKNEDNIDDKQFLKETIKEMNRLGMIIDLTHLEETNLANEVIDLSEAPVIFSHSSVFHLSNDPFRNIKNETLHHLKEKKGIIMINFHKDAIKYLNDTVTVKDVIEHINFVVKEIGIDHIGFGSAFGSNDKKPSGLDDVSEYPNLIKELVNSNGTLWTEEYLEKIFIGNIERVFSAVEEVKSTWVGKTPSNYQYSFNKLNDSDSECYTFK